MPTNKKESIIFTVGGDRGRGWPPPMSVKNGKETDAGVKLLLDPTIGNNALVDKLNEVKLTHNAEAKSKGAVIPFPKLEARKPKATVAEAVVVPADSAEAIDRDILSLIGRWGKLIDAAPADKVTSVRDAMRKAVEKNARDFAKLVGIVK